MKAEGTRAKVKKEVYILSIIVRNSMPFNCMEQSVN